MHNVADSSSDNDHLPTISLAHTYNTAKTPVSEICIAFMRHKQQSTTSVILSYITSWSIQQRLYWHLKGQFLCTKLPPSLVKKKTHSFAGSELDVYAGIITFKNSETKGMGHLGDAVQWNPVLSIKTAVLNFVKEGIHPVKTHGAGERKGRGQEKEKISTVIQLLTYKII